MRRDEQKRGIRRDKAERSLADEILDIGKRCAALPDFDHRRPEEILAYDEHGLPS